MNTPALEATTTIATTRVTAAGTVLRGVGAVLGGLITTFAVTTATDIALHALRVFPPFGQRMVDSLFLLALAYRIPFNVFGSYVAARLALARPMQHALALGAVGVAISTLGAITMWNLGLAWYSLANIAIAFPCAWAGGWLRVVPGQGFFSFGADKYGKVATHRAEPGGTP
jgi:uncharacterized membrane protein